MKGILHDHERLILATPMTEERRRLLRLRPCRPSRRETILHRSRRALERLFRSSSLYLTLAQGLDGSDS